MISLPFWTFKSEVWILKSYRVLLHSSNYKVNLGIAVRAFLSLSSIFFFSRRLSLIKWSLSSTLQFKHQCSNKTSKMKSWVNVQWRDLLYYFSFISFSLPLFFLFLLLSFLFFLFLFFLFLFFSFSFLSFLISLFYEYFHIWLSYPLWEINQPPSIFLKPFLNLLYLYYESCEDFSLNLFQLINVVSSVSLCDPLWVLTLKLHSPFF